MFTAEIDDTKVQAWLTDVPSKVQASLETAVYALAEKLRSHVVTTKLLGQVLNRVTGRLGQSIQYDVTSSSAGVVGRVYSAGDVPYARIQEYGGVIKHPGGTAFGITKDGTPVFISNAKASELGGNWPRTKPHDITLPARSYMRSSLADMKDEITQRMTRAVIEGLKQ